MRWMLFAAMVAAGCGPVMAGDVPAGELTLGDAPACVEGLGRIQAAVKCDVLSSYAAPGAVLCFDHGAGDAPVGGCTVEEQDSPSTPVYRAPCVAACPEGFAKMSPEAVAFLRSAHPELF